MMEVLNRVFDEYGQYYDLLYVDKNYYLESKWIVAALARHGVESGRLLEFGSGTGKHGGIITDFGYLVDGVEMSDAMIARVIPTDGFTCQKGDIRNVSMGRNYDAIISLFHVMSYQTENSDITSVFSNAANHLKEDGLFLFDFWYSPAVYAQRPSVRIKRLKNESTEIVRLCEPLVINAKNRVDVDYTINIKNVSSGQIKMITETHSMRHFSLPELDLIGSQTGFKRVMAEEFLTGKAPDDSTWGVCVVYKKI